MPPAATDGPVIGGALSLRLAPPAPPPPDLKGPGAGNLSGFVLMLAVFGGIAAKLGHKAMKSHASTSALQKAQKKAREMAAELRNAAQKERDEPKKPKNKRSSGSKQSKQADEEAAPLVDAEGGDDEEDEEPSKATLPRAGEANGTKADKKKKTKKLGKDGAAADNDDAVSALCFGAAASRRQAAAEPDAASAVTCDFCGIYDDEGILAEDDGDLMYEDEDDDITPNDSVSNIGFNRQPPPRKAPPEHQRAGARRAPFGADMPSIVEQDSAEQLEEGGNGPSPTRSDAFRTLGDLDVGELRRPVGSNDDGFSVVHERHIAMRNMIPDEKSVPAERRRTAKARKPAHSAGASEMVHPEVVLDDDDTSSDVTFNFSGGAASGLPRVPEPMDDDSGSDAGSAVTFNFGFEQQRHPVPPPTKRTPASTRPKGKQQPGRTQLPARHTPPARQVPKPEPVIKDEEEDEEDEEEDCDDNFTAVALSSRPRDPYLGMRGVGRGGGGGGIQGGKRAPPRAGRVMHID